jgi:hypothetical protein
MQRLHQQEFRQTPFGFDPGRRDQKKNRFAAISRRALRASCQRSRDQPAIRIDIQEDVVEALLG